MYYACVCVYVCVFSRIYISLRSLRNLNIIYVQSSRFSVGLFACCLPCPARSLPDPCTDPIRVGSPVPGPKWRTIHPSKRLSLAALSPQRLSFCCSFFSFSFSISPSSSSLLCLCLSLCYCFYLGKKRHRHRRHPSTRCPRSRPRPRSINAVVYLLDISETRPVQLSSALTSSNCPKFLGKRKQ